MQRLFSLPWKIVPDWFMGNRLKILMYHSISENPLDRHAVSPARFRRQMEALTKKQVVGLKEGLEYLNKRRSLKNIYVITFDDALLDFYTTALPTLREFEYPSTMFIPTGLVGTRSIWDSYDKTKPLMTWKQLEECQQWKITFGSHTASHTKLTGCTDEILMNELQTSLQTLKNRLKSVIPALAYPGGYHDDRVRQAVRAVGYHCGLGSASRWGNGPESDLFQLRRARINQ